MHNEEINFQKCKTQNKDPYLRGLLDECAHQNYKADFNEYSHAQQYENMQSQHDLAHNKDGYQPCNAQQIWLQSQFVRNDDEYCKRNTHNNHIEMQQVDNEICRRSKK